MAMVARALRLRQTSSAWREAIGTIVCGSRTFDLRGLSVSAVAALLGRPRRGVLSLATELLLEEACTVPLALADTCPQLAALSLRGAALSDQGLAAALRSFGPRSHLATLSLRGCQRAAKASISALKEGPARTLTALDLSGCHEAVCGGPLRLESLFRSMPRLLRLDLSGQSRGGVGARVIGSVLLCLTQLTHLSLDGCLLDDAALLLDGAGVGDDSPPAGPDSSGMAAPAADVRDLWRRMSRLSELSIADNSKVSGGACRRLLEQLPALAALDVGGSDCWPSELPALLGTIAASPSLRWLGCEETAWLDGEAADALGQLRALIAARQHGPALTIALSRHVLEALSGGASRLVESPGAGRAHPAAHAPPQPPPLQSWEEMEEALDGAWAAVCCPPAASSSSAVANGAHGAAPPSAPPYLTADYSRPARYRHVVRSIYHVSQGDQPLYGEGRAARSQTDAHGLRA